jgi:hypothetical protein
MQLVAVGAELPRTLLDGVWLMNVEVGDLHPLDVPYALIGFGEYYVAPGLAWETESGPILFALLDSDHDFFTADAGITIWRVPVDGSPAEPVLAVNGFFPSFDFSPGGDLVAYWRAPDRSNHRELHIASVDGGEHIIYAEGDVLEFLGWSPDGRSFVYGHYAETAFLGNVCSDPVQLAVYPWSVRWLDGDTFVFEVGDEFGSRLEVYEGRADGTTTLRLNLEAGSWYGVELIEE